MPLKNTWNQLDGSSIDEVGNFKHEVDEKEISILQHYVDLTSPRGVEGFNEAQAPHIRATGSLIYRLADDFIEMTATHTIIFMQHGYRTIMNFADIKKALELLSRTENRQDIIFALDEEGEDDEWIDIDNASSEGEESNKMQGHLCCTVCESPVSGDIADSSDHYKVCPICKKDGENENGEYEEEIEVDEEDLDNFVRNTLFPFPVGDSSDLIKGISIENIKERWQVYMQKTFHADVPVQNPSFFFSIVKVFLDAYVKCKIIEAKGLEDSLRAN